MTHRLRVNSSARCSLAMSNVFYTAFQIFRVLVVCELFISYSDKYRFEKLIVHVNSWHMVLQRKHYDVLVVDTLYISELNFHFMLPVFMSNFCFLLFDHLSVSERKVYIHSDKSLLLCIVRINFLYFMKMKSFSNVTPCRIY